MVTVEDYGSKQIRHMAPSQMLTLCQILDADESWKTLMSVIKCDQDPKSLKYNVQHMRMVESGSVREKRSCSGILIDEWGTSGKKLPTYQTLLESLVEARLYRAADFVQLNLLLREEAVERPVEGPGAKVSLPEPGEKPDCDHFCHNNSSPIVSATLPLSNIRSGLKEFEYVELEKGSSKFSEACRLGHGSFGSVYLCHLLLQPGDKEKGAVAVKRLGLNALSSPLPHNQLTQQFRTEVSTLSIFRHQNILSLVGYCCDGPELCLVYDYMPNGSLQDKLKEDGGRLSWEKRLSIAEGTARGIDYLHTLADRPHIHRDIKSANILLDQHLIPKLGDFGLARPAPMATMATTTIVGTTAYMSPEALRGDITVKMDVYSFGVVVLELVSGLLAWDENRESRSLVSYMDDIDNEVNIVDQRPSPANDTVALGLLRISQNCIEEKKHNQPDISTVLQQLTALH